jgi:ribosome-associated heat shock protein Hsp15
MRLDKWLWFARFYKTRTLAAKAVATGAFRVNGVRVAKPSAPIRAKSVLTFPLGPHIRVIRILVLGERRGPAPEARTLYEDLAPPPPPEALAPRPAKPAAREPGAGRPTKRERRETDRLRDPES